MSLPVWCNVHVCACVMKKDVCVFLLVFSLLVVHNCLEHAWLAVRIQHDCIMCEDIDCGILCGALPVSMSTLLWCLFNKAHSIATTIAVRMQTPPAALATAIVTVHVGQRWTSFHYFVWWLCLLHALCYEILRPFAIVYDYCPHSHVKTVHY